MPRLLKPACPGACAPQQEKSPQWEAGTLQKRGAPALTTGEKSAQQRRPSTAEVMYTAIFKMDTNKNLLYSSWNSAQCYMPAWMGGGFGGDTCISMAESLLHG